MTRVLQSWIDAGTAHQGRLESPAPAAARFPLAERIARNDAEDDGLETVIVRRRLTDDAANRGHVAIVEASTQGIGHQVFRECLNELMIGPFDQRPAQIVRPVDRRAIRQLTGRIDWRQRVRVVGAELTRPR